MAGRRTNVLDVREIVRRLKLAQSEREIAGELGTSRKAHRFPETANNRLTVDGVGSSGIWHSKTLAGEADDDTRVIRRMG